VCVGFGVSDASHARAAAEVADGVVVGSAIVRAAAERIENAFSLARTLRSALDS
jgi:tryptophan synthase alpha chain